MQRLERRETSRNRAAVRHQGRAFMTEKRSSSARLLGPTNIGATRMATAVVRPSRKRISPPKADDFRTPKFSSAIPKRSRCFNNLALQLLLDPLVRSIKY